MPGKFGKTTAQRQAILRNQASNLLWYGKLETTLGKAKEVKAYTEKLITTAIKTYADTVESVKTVVDAKGKESQVKVIKDGGAKLAARRKLMAKLYDLQEIRAPREKKAEFKARTQDVNHPLIEKLFNEIAPKYAERAQEKGQGGGYIRMYLLGARKGDGAEVAILELVD